MISVTPGQGGEGGQKRANSCGRPLWMAPKYVQPNQEQILILTHRLFTDSALKSAIVCSLAVGRLVGTVTC